MRLVRVVVVLVVVASVLVPSSGVGSGDVAVAQTVDDLCDAGSAVQFTDVGVGDYAAEYILCMRVLGLSVGRGDGGYGPDAELTRGQMASFLVRLWRDVLGRGCSDDVAVPFLDVAGNTHETNIGCLYGLGITLGTTATTYGPGDKLKASQISRFLLRVYEKTGGRCAAAGGELERGLECLLGLGVIPSKAEGGGDGSVTRAQMAVYVVGLWHNIAGRGVGPPPPAKGGELVGFDPFVTPSLSGLDLGRLAEAVATLDPGAECPEPGVPASYEDVVEVARIEGGCAFVEYVALDGRTVEEVQAEFVSDPTVHAVSLPAVGLRPETVQLSDDPLLPQWHLAQLDAAELWGGWPSGASVTVAVIDDGVDGSHRDLKDNVSRSGHSCHRDPNGDHGTHVAGIVAAEQGNDQDVAGVAPKATILPVKVHFGEDFRNRSTRTGPEDSDCYDLVPTLTRAIDLARADGADVINMSLRWFEETDYAHIRQQVGFIAAFRELILGVDTVEWAVRVSMMEGVVVVAAAGNCGDNTKLVDNGCGAHNQRQSPARYPGVIAVAATDSARNRAPFSTSNTDVDIAAPGDRILSTIPAYTAQAGDPCPTGTRCHVQVDGGTSMAAPVVAAVVAHMKARHPQATIEQIETALYTTADDKGAGKKTRDLGHGIIKPLAATQKLDQLINPGLVIPGTIPAVGGTPEQPTTPEPTQTPPEPAQPDIIPPPTSVTISAGWNHSCGVRTDGTAQCWGKNSHGQADAPSGTFTTISAGGTHSCALRTDGTAQCWGNNTRGEATAPAGTFTTISVGQGHSCGVRTDGTARCWGSNSRGQADAPSGTFTTISAGFLHSCGVRTDGTAECWGYNFFGEATAPSGTFTTISAGDDHSCALRTDGTAQCWGDNFHGQADAPSGTFTAISADHYKSCALRTDGTAECWGRLYVTVPAGTFAIISAGSTHSCGVRTDGTAECWGNNSDGRADAPAGTFAMPATERPSVTVTKGDPGPTTLPQGQGTPCAPNTPTCRYLNIQLSDFAPGSYTVACSHDGWNNTPAATWWTFNVTVSNDNSATVTRQCFINFASLTGSGAYVTVTKPGSDDSFTSNQLK